MMAFLMRLSARKLSSARAACRAGTLRHLELNALGSLGDAGLLVERKPTGLQVNRPRFGRAGRFRLIGIGCWFALVLEINEHFAACGHVTGCSVILELFS